jgi:hypothetical protein
VGIAATSIIVTLLLSVCVWAIYAYFFPHTWSGQLLIKVSCELTHVTHDTCDMWHGAELFLVCNHASVIF